MGNCCANESKAQNAHEERIRKEHEREEAKRQLEEGLKNMANGAQTHTDSDQTSDPTRPDPPTARCTALHRQIDTAAPSGPCVGLRLGMRMRRADERHCRVRADVHAAAAAAPIFQPWPIALPRVLRIAFESAASHPYVCIFEFACVRPPSVRLLFD